MICASSRAKLICLPLQGRRANYPSDIQILRTGLLHLMESDPRTVHPPSKKKRRTTCLAGTNIFRCLKPHENIALEEKLPYRNGSASGNEHGTYPALRRILRFSFLLSSTFSTFATFNTAKPSIGYKRLCRGGHGH